MHKLTFFLFFFYFYVSHAACQVFPKDGSVLNYRIIGFSVPFEKEGITYKIQIAKGYQTSIDSFRKNIIETCNTNQSKIIIEVPSFGAQYTWYVAHIDGNPPQSGDSLHHFATGLIPDVDNALTHFRIIKKAKKYKDAFVFVDGTRSLYDMQGNPVWYLPDFDSTNDKKSPRDLKITKTGSITFLMPKSICEINYNGNVLWKKLDTSSGEDATSFHHEFTKLTDGHYLALSNKHSLWKLPFYDSLHSLHNFRVISKNNEFLQMVTVETLNEYDSKGELIWSWDPTAYYKESDLYKRVNRDGTFDIDPHINSFYFDEKNKIIYVSFKNFSRIVKVKYPEGTVLGAYGNPYLPGTNTFTDLLGSDLFCGQHSCKLSDQGNLYLYNNNSATPGNLPKIIMLKEVADSSEKLIKLWEYQCTIEDTSRIRAAKLRRFEAFGNVIELPGQAMFVSMGPPYSKVFIVSKDKKVIWSAIPEKYDNNIKKWTPVDIYRASIILTRKDLEKLIWVAEK